MLGKVSYKSMRRYVNKETVNIKGMIGEGNCSSNNFIHYDKRR